MTGKTKNKKRRRHATHLSFRDILQVSRRLAIRHPFRQQRSQHVLRVVSRQAGASLARRPRTAAGGPIARLSTLHERVRRDHVLNLDVSCAEWLIGGRAKGGGGEGGGRRTGGEEGGTHDDAGDAIGYKPKPEKQKNRETNKHTRTHTKNKTKQNSVSPFAAPGKPASCTAC